MRDLTKEESDKYMEIVKGGSHNMDDMFNFGYELGKKDSIPRCTLCPKDHDPAEHTYV